MKSYQILQGDCVDVLKTLAARSVHCVITSPPYFGLRDYGTADWEGGDPECDHKPSSTPAQRGIASPTLDGGQATNGHRHEGYKDTCPRCGAARIDQQIGLEETPEAYVAKLVAVFREVWRVLRDDGVLWLNLGDSYNSDASNQQRNSESSGLRSQAPDAGMGRHAKRVPGLKPKDLIGIPWRVAFALQADGWYLRSDIIWHKPNPMPESVTDRPTKAHEYLFLLTKSARYFYDAEAIKEPSTGQAGSAADFKRATKESLVPGQAHVQHRLNRNTTEDNGTRNKRSVWTIATQPYAEAHFATFPPKLIEPCILAGTSEKGCCASCGAQWERVTEKEVHTNGKGRNNIGGGFDHGWEGTPRGSIATTTTGWQPTCTCAPTDPIPCTVLDPFNGAGTTGVVAGTHGRDYIGIELNPDYIEMADRRVAEVYRVQNRQWAVQKVVHSMHEDLPLFEAQP
jgi:DNA modification methylase